MRGRPAGAGHPGAGGGGHGPGSHPRDSPGQVHAYAYVYAYAYVKSEAFICTYLCFPSIRSAHSAPPADWMVATFLLSKEETRKFFSHEKVMLQNAYCEVTHGSKEV